MSENRKTWVELVFIVLGLLVAAGIIFASSDKSNSTAVSSKHYSPTDSSTQDALDQSKVETTPPAPPLPTPAIDTSSLDSQINTIIGNNTDIAIGVSIKDINTGTIYNYGYLNPMTAASVTKVLTAVDYLKEVELGNKSLDTIMSNGYSAQYNMEQMIVVSDNDAWHILNDSLGYPQMQAYAESIGITSYYYGDNTINVSDVTNLLGDLYERKLINESNTQLLLSYMERANYRDLIIPAVPDYDTVYHKAGSLYANLHDATIITNSTHTIVLTIFTESLYNFDKNRVTSIMQQITTPTLETFHLN